MSSTLYVDKLIEKTSAAGVHIPGHVIQTQYMGVTGDIATTSTTPVSSGLSKAFTPKYANSVIRLSVMGGRIYTQQASKQMDMHLYVDGVSGATVFGNGYGRISSVYDNASSSVHPGANSCIVYVPATNTSSRTYQIYFKVSTGSNLMYLNQGADLRVYFSVEEIAQ